MRWKRTEICQTCAKIKNTCQCCLLDLELGLPTKIRDAVLDSHGGMPSTDVNTQVYVRKMEEQMGDDKVVNHGKAESAAKEVLRKLARTSSDPYQTKSKAPLCSFFIKGICKRGLECPMRHEKPFEHRKQHPPKQGQASASGPASGSAATADAAGQQQHKKQQQQQKRRAPIPQSHAQAHAQSELAAAARDRAVPSAAAMASKLAHVTVPPPPPGEGPAVLHPSQNPAILGTATRSFTSA
nr:Pre-mRNA-splicing factor slt11 [Polyrhizophydium stewartii]